MPTRLIREGILTSERVEQLDAPAEVFYRRLMSKVDDHGLYDGRISILRTSLYPLRVDRVREADISRWIAACEKAGLIALYQHDGKPYLQMLDTRWTTRSEPKYPLPPDGGCAPPCATENSCKQVGTVVPVFGDVVEGVGVVGLTTSDEVVRARQTPEHRPPLAIVTGKPKTAPDCPHLAVLALWAEVLPALPQHDPQQWRGARADHLRARWRETAVAKGWATEADGLLYLRRLFGYVGQSPFLTGRTPSRDRRPFAVELAWLVKPENWAKTVEGKYHAEEATA